MESYDTISIEQTEIIEHIQITDSYIYDPDQEAFLYEEPQFTDTYIEQMNLYEDQPSIFEYEVMVYDGYY